MTPIFHGKVTDDGTFQPFNSLGLREHVASLAGKFVEVIIRPERKQRSGEQNRYYHGVVVKILAEHCGYTPAEMHDALRVKFLSEQSGELLKVRSTTDLTTKEFEEYAEQIRVWASAELGCFVPLPNEAEPDA